MREAMRGGLDEQEATRRTDSEVIRRDGAIFGAAIIVAAAIIRGAGHLVGSAAVGEAKDR
jgi:hypothetical protein